MTPPHRYDEAVDYILGLDLLGMRFGLERMQRLLALLGDPHRAYPCVHVVGTNGKTSTSRMCAGILAAHGQRAGTYLSPHVTGWNERVELDGLSLDPTAFADAVLEVRDTARRLGDDADDKVTQFEALTAAAYLAFARANCDVAVVEAGLGGRWDATNVIEGGRVTVLTNIALEHTHLLGDTVRAIAGEKLAVAPDGSDRLVVGRLDEDAADAVRDVCTERHLTGWWMGRDFHVGVACEAVTVTCVDEVYGDIRLGVRGAFQTDNVATAIAAARMFLGQPLDADRVRQSAHAVRVPGRLEVFPGEPQVIIDGAHNPAGMNALAQALPDVARGRVVAVVSLLDDKDADAMLRALAGCVDAVIATRSRHARALDPHVIAEKTRNFVVGPGVAAEPDAARAIARAREDAGSTGTVLVCGSLYLLADIRQDLAEGRIPGETAPVIDAGQEAG